ncbi:hypothetical protein C882_3388 [Caenispirillum salinarum AK4]|uniref:Methyltransferase n=1 Tax=Caenispirillum salinarum AK4 TaxID=1238182 RepID=K9H5I2_9PROT|nr:TylF/MycF/NovP-related O-methyltransferase [Caenispirillum salinarum]EKV25903.1 hypothetical protein C882_3388 [Caenispirillum salinarum AK4]
MMKCRHPSAARRAVAKLAFLSDGTVDRVDGAGRFIQKIANTIRFEHFWKRHVASNPDLKVVPSFTANRSKHPIWDIAIEKVTALATDGQVLEFGTNNGGWLHYLVNRLPQTMTLHGFDCFEGLPEEWDGLPRGAIRGFGFPAELWGDDKAKREAVLEEFKRTEVMPTPPQPNIRIHSGLFSEALPRYMPNGEVPRDIRLIHFDADLYISTRPVLDTLCGQMDYEYFILFDEFYSANHEFRAWVEFIELFKLGNWKVAATSEDGVQVLVHMNPGAGPSGAAG